MNFESTAVNLTSIFGAGIIVYIPEEVIGLKVVGFVLFVFF